MCAQSSTGFLSSVDGLPGARCGDHVYQAEQVWGETTDNQAISVFSQEARIRRNLRIEIQLWEDMRGRQREGKWSKSRGTGENTKMHMQFLYSRWSQSQWTTPRWSRPALMQDESNQTWTMIYFSMNCAWAYWEDARWAGVRRLIKGFKLSGVGVQSAWENKNDLPCPHFWICCNNSFAPLLIFNYARTIIHIRVHA